MMLKTIVSDWQRLFVAVWPPDEVVDELTTLPREPGFGVTWAEPSSWHITLRFLGRADPAATIERLASANLAAATASIGPTTERFGESYIVVPVSGLDALAAQVAAVTKDIAVVSHSHPFVGHITLGRFPDPVAAQCRTGHIRAAFRVGCVVVAQRSDATSGPSYTILEKWKTQ